MLPDKTHPISSRRIWIARGIAVAADALQIAVFPAFVEGFFSPVSDVLDVVVCIALTLLVGWHIAFLPSFIIKFAPFADLAPTWTIAILIATRKGAAAPKEQQILSGPDKKIEKPYHSPNMITLDEFESLAKARRATRNFSPDPVAVELLERLIEIARWSPSGYNLQPTHFVLVTDPTVKARLVPACLKQRQVAEAAAVIVITGDRRVAENNFKEMLDAEKSAGSIDEAYEKLLRKIIPLVFGQGPAGLGRLWKSALPVLGPFMPIPSIPAVYMRYWLTKQTMLCAMTLMLAATAAGLATLPMEGFDERRVRRVLRIPRSQMIPVVIAVGYSAEKDLKKTRLPLERFVHRDGW
jgi:nitroreductase